MSFSYPFLLFPSMIVILDRPSLFRPPIGLSSFFTLLPLRLSMSPDRRFQKGIYKPLCFNSSSLRFILCSPFSFLMLFQEPGRLLSFLRNFKQTIILENENLRWMFNRSWPRIFCSHYPLGPDPDSIPTGSPAQRMDSIR